ncbi:MAG: flagellar hook capping FlgD N-terminal domain-containing protein [Burkholderiaceae bacterium]
MIDATSSATAAASAAASTGSGATSMAGAEDRFLKLLVAQLNNQDPMNPMDNAQMTSQMAQINTVTSVQQVNDTLKSLSTQLSSLQMLQGSSLVGHDVLVQGSTLALDANGKTSGAVDLDTKADSVKIDILSAGGQVVDTIDLGAQSAGRHTFDWNASGHLPTGTPSFRVRATLANTNVTYVPLARDKVVSVGSENGSMNVQLQGLGSVAYDSVKTIL